MKSRQEAMMILNLVSWEKKSPPVDRPDGYKDAPSKSLARILNKFVKRPWGRGYESNLIRYLFDADPDDHPHDLTLR